MQTITDFLNLPFIEVLKLLMKVAVEDYLTESGVLAAIAAIPAKATKKDNEGLNAEEAMEFLNANGYPIKKPQRPLAVGYGIYNSSSTGRKSSMTASSEDIKKPKP